MRPPSTLAVLSKLWNGNQIMRVTVAFATTGRAAVLRRVLPLMAEQTHQPERVVLSVASATDAEGAVLPSGRLLTVSGPKGLSAQRNTAIAAAGDSDVIVFFDDDFLPAPRWIEAVVAVFRDDPTVVIATGQVVADGILGPGLSFEEAKAALAADTAPSAPGVHAVEGGYGCNMAIRMSAIGDMRFDEALPLYGWLEDLDFSRRAARRGRIVRVEAARGAHMGVKTARQPGLRLGYSQVANPLHIWRGGVISLRRAFALIGRRVLANHARAIAPEPWVDRRGRLRGNWVAIGDAVRGRVSPGKVLDL